ncbi:MAG: L,D-transpeptidase family protein [Geminicoccaceae bacterium]
MAGSIILQASRRTVLTGLGLAAATPALAVLPILPEPSLLPPDGFAWQPEVAPKGPVLVLVGLTEQIARIYRNGLEIGIARVSTGRPGYPTPTGVFTILQKARVHHSTTYDEASMPYTERLTWDGVALHAGIVPGYPSSHGCVHLPLAFAELLYGVTEVGTTVVIADEHRVPSQLARPGLLQPGGELPAPAGDHVWEPERAPAGPLSLLVSIADGRCYAFRNGMEIGRAAARFARPDEPVLPAIYLMLERRTTGGAPVWTEVGLFGAKAPATRSDALDRLTLPPGFAAALMPALVPGTSLYCALGSGGESRTGPGLTVVSARPA